MNRSVRSQQGMTLVEVMVAGVIGLIPATIIIVLYATYSSQLRENSARLALQRQYETVTQEVAAHARRAYRVRGSTSCFDSCSDQTDTLSTVFFFDSCPDPFAGLMVWDDTLRELQGTDTVVFTAGSPVLVNSDNCRFIIPGCGNRLTVQLRLKQEENDTVFFLEPPECEYRCRN